MRQSRDQGHYTLTIKLVSLGLSFLSISGVVDEAALALVARQGFGKPEDFGPKAPTTIKALVTHLRGARALGYSTIIEVFAPAMSAMAAAVRGPGGQGHRRRHHRKPAGAF